MSTPCSQNEVLEFSFDLSYTSSLYHKVRSAHVQLHFSSSSDPLPWTSVTVSCQMNHEEQQLAFKVRPQRGELCHDSVVVTPQHSLVVPKGSVLIQPPRFSQVVDSFIFGSFQFPVGQTMRSSSLHSTCPRPRESCHDSVVVTPQLSLVVSKGTVEL